MFSVTHNFETPPCTRALIYRPKFKRYENVSKNLLIFILLSKYFFGRPLGRPRRRWEDNIKMDLQEVGGVVGTGWSWLRIGRGGGRLWVR